MVVGAEPAEGDLPGGVGSVVLDVAERVAELEDRTAGSVVGDGPWTDGVPQLGELLGPRLVLPEIVRARRRTALVINPWKPFLPLFFDPDGLDTAGIRGN